MGDESSAAENAWRMAMIENMRMLALVLLLAASAGAVAADALRSADFYVSPKGNDDWSGRLPDPDAGGATVRLLRWNALAMRFGV